MTAQVCQKKSRDDEELNVSVLGAAVDNNGVTVIANGVRVEELFTSSLTSVPGHWVFVPSDDKLSKVASTFAV